MKNYLKLTLALIVLSSSHLALAVTKNLIEKDVVRFECYKTDEQKEVIVSDGLIKQMPLMVEALKDGSLLEENVAFVSFKNQKTGDTVSGFATKTVFPKGDATYSSWMYELADFKFYLTPAPEKVPTTYNYDIIAFEGTSRNGFKFNYPCSITN
jgi:hypothetical protein